MGPAITRTCYLRNRPSAIQFKRDPETSISRLYCSIGKIYKELNSKIKSPRPVESRAARCLFASIYSSVFNEKSVPLSRFTDRSSLDISLTAGSEVVMRSNHPCQDGCQPVLASDFACCPAPALKVTLRIDSCRQSSAGANRSGRKL